MRFAARVVSLSVVIAGWASLVSADPSRPVPNVDVALDGKSCGPAVTGMFATSQDRDSWRKGERWNLWSEKTADGKVKLTIEHVAQKDAKPKVYQLATRIAALSDEFAQEKKDASDRKRDSLEFMEKIVQGATITSKGEGWGPKFTYSKQPYVNGEMGGVIADLMRTACAREEKDSGKNVPAKGDRPVPKVNVALDGNNCASQLGPILDGGERGLPKAWEQWRFWYEFQPGGRVALTLEDAFLDPKTRSTKTSRVYQLSTEYLGLLQDLAAEAERGKTKQLLSGTRYTSQAKAALYGEQILRGETVEKENPGWGQDDRYARQPTTELPSTVAEILRKACAREAVSAFVKRNPPEKIIQNVKKTIDETGDKIQKFMDGPGKDAKATGGKKKPQQQGAGN